MEIALIPESAPFTVEQRAWLNGFLSGWIGLAGAATQGAALAKAILAGPAAAEPPPPEPWHDPALALDNRLQLADGQPPARRLMAAMAQLDCGACGYLCRTYAEAIAVGTEPRLNLCSPGGAETSKTIKRLLKESAAPANGKAAATKTNGSHVNGDASSAQNGWSRANPFTARLLRSTRLNGIGSEKSTHHVEIELGGDGPSYAVGDSLGLYPENCASLVSEVLTALGATGDEPATPSSGRLATINEALTRDRCLTELTDALFTLLADSARNPDDADRLRQLADDDGAVDGWDVLDLLRAFPSVRVAPEALVEALSPLRPRLYSISSSPRKHAGQVHLTVRRVTYPHRGRERVGVASTMLADRVGPGAPLRVFIQKSHGFSLPGDAKAPIVMIGPGTGIAPFRAFLHERDALGDVGPAWLFFGDQHGSHDFLYEEELADFRRRGVLSRLDTAFSRDQEEKLYVQHRILEHGDELFRWLEDGAYVYVCGDAKRMASDVDRALAEVVRARLGGDAGAAKTYMARLTSEGRYRRDVY